MQIFATNFRHSLTMEQVRFDEFFKAPFKNEHSLMKCCDGQSAFLYFFKIDNNFKDLVVKKLNNPSSLKFGGKWRYDGCNMILLNDLKVMETRGLGDLLSCKKFELTPYAASKVVDSFAYHCVDILNS